MNRVWNRAEECVWGRGERLLDGTGVAVSGQAARWYSSFLTRSVVSMMLPTNLYRTTPRLHSHTPAPERQLVVQGVEAYRKPAASVETGEASADILSCCTCIASSFALVDMVSHDRSVAPATARCAYDGRNG